MSILDEIQADISAFSATIEFAPTNIPADLADMPTLEAVHKRLQSLVESVGGYEALAVSVPLHNATVWRNKIESTGRFKLNSNDLEPLFDYFKDPVLVALFGHKFGLEHFDLNSIPPSDYSLSDLSWALRRYQAQGQLLTCELRERQMDGEPTDEVKKRLAQLTKETIVLLKQMDLALKAIAPTKSGK